MTYSQHGQWKQSSNEQKHADISKLRRSDLPSFTCTVLPRTQSRHLEWNFGRILDGIRDHLIRVLAPMYIFVPVLLHVLS